MLNRSASFKRFIISYVYIVLDDDIVHLKIRLLIVIFMHFKIEVARR